MFTPSRAVAESFGSGWTSLGQRNDERLSEETVVLSGTLYRNVKLMELKAAPCSIRGRIRPWTLQPFVHVIVEPLPVMTIRGGNAPAIDS